MGTYIWKIKKIKQLFVKYVNSLNKVSTQTQTVISASEIRYI